MSSIFGIDQKEVDVQCRDDCLLEVESNFHERRDRLSLPRRCGVIDVAENRSNYDWNLEQQGIDDNEHK